MSEDYTVCEVYCRYFIGAEDHGYEEVVYHLVVVESLSEGKHFEYLLLMGNLDIFVSFEPEPNDVDDYPTGVRVLSFYMSRYRT